MLFCGSTTALVPETIAHPPQWARIFIPDQTQGRRCASSAPHVHGNRQGREIRRKLDLPGVRNLALEFVCDFQSSLVQAAAR
jgi:hypothetical protein